MFKKTAVFLFSLVMVIVLSGCATARKKSDLENQGLRNQISVLEAQVQSKDAEISSLRSELEAAKSAAIATVAAAPQTGKKKVIAEVKSRPSIKQIQIALTNAGYNPGRIDAKLGRQTKDAIRAFQRANNLSVNGKVGKKTWELLKEYLYKKVK